MAVFFLILCMVACEDALYESDSFTLLSVADFEVRDGQVEILVLEEYIRSGSSILGHHSSKEEFKKGYFYTSGRLRLDELMSGRVERVNFDRVGEIKKSLIGPRLSHELKNSIVVDMNSKNLCGSYAGKCRVIERVGGGNESPNFDIDLVQSKMEMVLKNSLNGKEYSVPFSLDTDVDLDYELVVIKNN